MPQFSAMKTLPYDIGLDIGIASVGWCVLDDTRIIDLGVRAFNKAETEKGEALNAMRRAARLLRRRLRRRAWRLRKLSRLLKREGLIADANLFLQQSPVTQSLWALRVEALDRCLSGEEWARVIYHLCKHRGFYFPRKCEEEQSEGGKVKKGLAETRRRMQDKNYRTAAEMMLREFPNHQRNKRGDYGQSLGRELLSEELSKLFIAQRVLGNPYTHTAFEQAILDKKHGLFWQQKPALSGKAMLELIGRCTFEKGECRAAKHTWSAERFVWLTKLNNLRLSIHGEIRPLNEAERLAVIDLPYQLVSVKFKQLKEELVKLGLLPDSARFKGLDYRDNGKDAVGTKTKDPEEAKLIELKGWHDVRKALEKAGLKTIWQGLATQPQRLDAITTVLSIYKTDEEVRSELAKLNLEEVVIEAFMGISFTNFIRLSLPALAKILPSMEKALRYDQACEAAGYQHSQPRLDAASNKVLLLPSFYTGRDKKKRKMLLNEEQDIPRNPVVLRALNQARSVVNAIIRRYGSPQRVHIEMARDLSRPLDERQKIEKKQKSFGENNERLREEFNQAFGYFPKSREFEKWLLYREQHGNCAYSLQALNLERVINEVGYAEVDHALPYSRSFDDTRNNKVLVLTRENRDKGNRTPFEYLDGANHSSRWQDYEGFVQSNREYRQAKRDRLLRKHFSAEDAKDFKARNLNDTRYICTYFKNFIEQNLRLAGDAQRCVVLSGQLTHFLRARWGLTKARQDSDRHHALDAAVVAACSHAMVNKLTDYSLRKELKQVQAGFVDKETGEVLDLDASRRAEQHFPRPWPHFAEELCLRLGIDRSTGAVMTISDEEKKSHLKKLGYDIAQLASLRSLFVSRAPQRRGTGAAHKATVYAQPERLKKQGGATERVALNTLTLNDLERLVNKEREPNLCAALRQRLEAHGGKGDKAFSADNPFYKPTKDGRQGALVRTVTLEINKQSGIPVRSGIAANGDALRVDVFTKRNRFYLVPIYIHHRVLWQRDKTLPDRAIVAKKDETEWTQIDDSFTFVFSLYPNDLVQVSLKAKAPIRGYYGGVDRDNGRIKLWMHDRNKQISEDGGIRVATKTAIALEKFHVDVLGRIYPAKPESRRGLA